MKAIVLDNGLVRLASSADSDSVELAAKAAKKKTTKAPKKAAKAKKPAAAKAKPTKPKKSKQVDAPSVSDHVKTVLKFSDSKKKLQNHLDLLTSAKGVKKADMEAIAQHATGSVSGKTKKTIAAHIMNHFHGEKKPAKKGRLGKGLEALVKEPKGKAAGKSVEKVGGKAAKTKPDTTAEGRVAHELTHAGIKSASAAHKALYDHFRSQINVDQKGRPSPSTLHMALPEPTGDESVHGWLKRAHSKVPSSHMLEAARHISAAKKGHDAAEAELLKKKGGAAEVLKSRRTSAHNLVKQISGHSEVTHHEMDGDPNAGKHSMTLHAKGEEAIKKVGSYAVGHLLNAGFSPHAQKTNHRMGTATFSHPRLGEMHLALDKENGTLTVSHNDHGSALAKAERKGTKETAGSRHPIPVGKRPLDIHAAHDRMLSKGFHFNATTGMFHHKDGSVAELQPLESKKTGFPQYSVQITHRDGSVEHIKH